MLGSYLVYQTIQQSNMSEPVGFRMNINECLSALTIEQVKELIAKMERKLAELRKLVDNNLSLTGAELILRNIGESLEYDIAVMTNDQEILAKYQSIDD
jgi:hypothetical protein